MDIPSPEKICVRCGEDCSSRPRIKDPRGRYYCKHCYDKAKAELEAKKAEAEMDFIARELEPAPPVAPPVAPPTESAEAPPVQPTSCPECGAALAPGAVICTNCGYNVQTGHTVEPTLVAPPAGIAVAAGRSTWPLVIGIVSVVFGAGGTLYNGFNLVVRLLSLGSSAPSVLLEVAAMSLWLCMSLWLLAGGIGVIQRKQQAAVSIRRWAIVKTILYVTCFSFAVLAFVFFGDMVRETLEELGGETAGLSVGLLAALTAIVLGWVLAWPIFILIWFSRDAIQEDVGTW